MVAKDELGSSVKWCVPRSPLITSANLKKGDIKRSTLAGLLFCAAVISLVGACGDDDSNGNDNTNVNINGNTNTNANGNTNTNTNTNNNTTDDDTIYQLQDENDPDFIPVGSTAQLNGVVVTAVDLYGPYDGDVFVQEPDGGPYSGVLLYNPTVTGGTLSDLTIGHVVNVSGEKAEFALTSDTSGRTTTELLSGTIERVAPGIPLDPEVIASPQIIMTEPGAEQYESVLVSLNNIRRQNVDSYENVHCSGQLTLGPDLMDIAAATADGSCYSKVVGILDYFFYYSVLPRSTGDLTLAADQNICDLTTEICDDGTDNDNDGFIDCLDFDCDGTAACTETDCEDGADNDNDGFIDCDDPDCLLGGACRENDPTRCDDGLDNDHDGLVDCADWSCAYHPDVLAAGLCGQETGDASCTDGIDNDSDGYADCLDFSCQITAAQTVCATAMESSAALCADGVDNNGNGHTDCADFGCQYNGFCPAEETDDTQCSDGLDNDNDTHIDCQDWSCQRSLIVTVCEGTIYTCSDGLDNDGNGHADCDDFACRDCSNNRSVPVCPPCP